MSADFDALIFDLDDTLLETTRLLTRPSFEYAFTMMRQHGLDVDIDTCFQERKKTVIKYNRDEFLYHLAKKYCFEDDTDACLRIGVEAFQQRSVELDITMNAETRDTLKTLSAKYPLFLVTAGSRPTQKRKVELLEIGAYFKHCFFIETRRKERKREAFYKIEHTIESVPERLLSIGNRLDLEIAESKELGLKTCHILKGEYSHLAPRCSLEIPDYTIREIKEITNICHL